MDLIRSSSVNKDDTRLGFKIGCFLDCLCLVWKEQTNGSLYCASFISNRPYSFPSVVCGNLNFTSANNTITIHFWHFPFDLISNYLFPWFNEPQTVLSLNQNIPILSLSVHHYIALATEHFKSKSQKIQIRGNNPEIEGLFSFLNVIYEMFNYDMLCVHL